MGSLFREIFMAKVKTPHKRHIGKEKVKTSHNNKLWGCKCNDGQ
jgi:hypothetical protein